MNHKILWGFCLVLLVLALTDAPLPIAYPVLAGAMEEAQGPVPATVQVSIIYPDSLIIPLEVFAAVPDTCIPKKVTLKVWKNGTVISAQYIPDSATVRIVRAARALAK